MNPVAVGSRFEGRARNLSSDGRAVVEDFQSKFVYFVEGSWPGDEGTFEVLSLEKRYGFAKVVELRKLSPQRVAVECQYQGVGEGKCGGCSWMIGSYESQLESKTHRLRHALERAKLIAPDDQYVLRVPLPSSEIYGYRNRVQVKSDGMRMGFLSLGSTQLGDIKECVVMNERLRALYSSLRTRIEEPALQPSGPHKFVFVDLDDDVAPEDVRTLAVNHRRPFKQGNTSQNEKMKNWVRERVFQFCANAFSSAFPTSQGVSKVSVLELFAGSGNFTHILLQEKNVGKVFAVEVVDEALEKLANSVNSLRGAQLSHLKHSLASRADFEKLARKISTQVFDFWLIDPPREGAPGIEFLMDHAKQKPRCIFYISCDVATFARDGAQMAKRGYQLTEVTPIDLFPHTPHIEVLGVFQLSNPGSLDT